MPKPKRPKRKGPLDLVDRPCKAAEQLTTERASRSYGPQWVMVHDVARRLGISDEQATALALERHCIAHVADLEDRRRATTCPVRHEGGLTSPPMGSLGGGGHCRPSPVRPPPRSSTPSIRAG